MLENIFLFLPIGSTLKMKTNEASVVSHVFVVWYPSAQDKSRTDPLNLASFLSRPKAAILQAHSKIFQLLHLL